MADAKGGSKRILIVGGSSGIGLATAQILAAGGGEVHCTGTRDAPPALQDCDAEYHRLTISNHKDVGTLGSKLAPLHAVVISVGRPNAGTPFFETPFADMAAQISLRLAGVLGAVHTLADYVAENGSVTLVSGIAARRAFPGTAPLSVVNAGLEAAVMALTKEFAPKRINAVSPGRLDNSFWDHLPDDLRAQMRETAKGAVPLQRLGSSEDVALAIKFLIEHPFVTGTILDCDGGMKSM